MPPRLPFGEVLSESFSFFFGNLRFFFHLVTIPWILSLLLRVLDATAGQDAPMGALFEKVLDAVPTTMFMVGWMRFVLLGPRGVQRLPGIGWTRRETNFLIHLIQVAGITFVLLAAFLLTVGSIDPAALNSGQIDPQLVRREAMAAPLGLGFIVSSLLALRVSFGLAATAVDVPFSPRHSWAYSRGNGRGVIAVLFVIYLAGALAIMMAALVPYAVVNGIFGADLGAAVVAWASGILVSYASVGVAATAQAVVFRRLTKWRPGTALEPPSA
ncbi:MAG TPA: hypothetical protein VFB13_00930 [Reyranella sp.]|nr:hypothetical protein [Reyranella sp.]